MPILRRRGAAILAVLITPPAAASAAPACPAGAPGAGAVVHAVAPAPGGGLTVRIPARRPGCGVLVALPASGARVLSRPGGAVRVVRQGRPAVRVVPGANPLRIAVARSAQRITITWPGHRAVVPVRLRAESRVFVLGAASTTGARVTPTAAPTGTTPGTTPATPGGTTPSGGGGTTTPRPPSTTPPATGGGGTTTTPAVTRPARLFAAGSVWNSRVEGLPLASDTAALSANLAGQAARTGTWMNTTTWSVPVYVVGPNVPRVTVVDNDDGDMNLAGQWRWGTVPLPTTAVAAGPSGGDHHLVVWQPSSDTMWEFWNFSRAGGVPQSPHGARITGVSTFTGSIPAPFGATASGIPAAAGLVTSQDLARGSIDHALVIGLPYIRTGSFLSPATRTDGWTTDATDPLMGQRFRLDPAVDVAALNLPPLARMVALAVQRYGLVVRDTSGSVSFYGEDPVSTGSNPFTAALAGQDMGVVMRQFPWDHIQALAP
ncbi:MAG: hypothetical protein U0Y82_08645 [Thermoleophilia bacterium]